MKRYSSQTVLRKMTEKNELKYYPLYHGMRSKKTSDEIKKEGFCSYSNPINERKNIVDALKYFKKEKLLTTEGKRGSVIREIVAEITHNLKKSRLNTWATTNKESACAWWAHTNPEHITLVLDAAGISAEEIDSYLRNRFGDECYSVKLKMTSLGSSPNFNTGLNCIPANLIELVEKCDECKFTGKEHKKKD